MLSTISRSISQSITKPEIKSKPVFTNIRYMANYYSFPVTMYNNKNNRRSFNLDNYDEILLDGCEIIFVKYYKSMEGSSQYFSSKYVRHHSVMLCQDEPTAHMHYNTIINRYNKK